MTEPRPDAGTPLFDDLRRHFGLRADPVDDPAYPGITEATAVDLTDVQPQPGWDTDPALAPTQRAAGDDVLEPDEAWAALCAHDEAAGR